MIPTKQTDDSNKTVAVETNVTSSAGELDSKKIRKVRE
jgi:hypothetical protein